MALYRRILVPVDGSTTSLKGLKEALRLARAMKAKLVLLHVLDEFYIAASPELATSYDEVVGALRDGGRRILAKAEKAARTGGVKPETVLCESLAGRAGPEIVRQAKKARADLIVIGTHGRKGLQRLALGSDAEQVVRNSRVPVLLVKA
jgi:nucleotide-binding universal stress UspA family protein